MGYVFFSKPNQCKMYKECKDHSTLGAESAHCGPDTPKIYSVEMEDDHTYHKMKMHDTRLCAAAHYKCSSSTQYSRSSEHYFRTEIIG